MGTFNNITAKEQEALSIIRNSLAKTSNPMVFCSFGKDSMVMLNLVQRVRKSTGKDISVVYLMDGLPAEKYLHAFTIAAKLGITLYSYPPSFSFHLQGDDYFEIYHGYYIDGKDWYILSTGCRKPFQDESYSCAVYDLLDFPCISTYDFRWDCIFHGHKEVDKIYITKDYKISPVCKFGKGLLVVPLYDWTDEDVLDYARIYSLPLQSERYDGNPTGKSVDPEHDRLNADVVPTCYRCLDVENENKQVFCPRKGEMISYRGTTREEHRDNETFLTNKIRYFNQEVRI